MFADDSHDGGLNPWSFDDESNSFEQFSKKEAISSAALLQQISDKLNGKPIQAQPESMDDSSTRGYYSEGYDANYIAVSDKELASWQNNFYFISILGQSIVTNLNLPENGNTHDELELRKVVSDGPYFDVVTDSREDLKLFIEGRSILPSEINACLPLKDEEVLAVDGQLEETFILHTDHDISHGQLATKALATHIPTETCLSPSTSMKVEVISSLVDAIWPDVVNAMQPLIDDILTVASQFPRRKVNEHLDYAEPKDNVMKMDQDDDW